MLTFDLSESILFVKHRKLFYYIYIYIYIYIEREREREKEREKKRERLYLVFFCFQHVMPSAGIVTTSVGPAARVAAHHTFQTVIVRTIWRKKIVKITKKRYA